MGNYKHIPSLSALAEHFSARLSFEEFCKRAGGARQCAEMRSLWEHNERLHDFREKEWLGEISFSEATKNIPSPVVGRCGRDLFMANGDVVDVGGGGDHAPANWLRDVRQRGR